jgi:AMP deaminase
MHRKTLTQLLEFAKTVERERERDDSSDGGGSSPQNLKKSRSHGQRKGSNGHYNKRGSASLPDVTAISGGGIDGEEKRNGQVLYVEGIPAGLPRLHTLLEGMIMPDFSPESIFKARLEFDSSDNLIYNNP